MKNKTWFIRYLLFMGLLILALGVMLIYENLHRHSYPGIFLGVAFVIYGFLRLMQRKNLFRES